MKRGLFAFLPAALLLTALLVGCTSDGGEKRASSAARQLLTAYYTVDAQTADHFNAQDPLAISNLMTKFQPMLTENELDAFVENRSYVENVITCKAKKTTVSPQKVELKKTSGDFQYDFTVSLKVGDDSAAQEELGQIGITKEGDSYKVNSFCVLKGCAFFGP